MLKFSPKIGLGMLINVMLVKNASFEQDVLQCSVTVILLQHRSCSVSMSFVRLGHHNG